MVLLTDLSQNASDQHYGAALFIVQIVSGFFTWELCRSLPFDFSVVRNKHGYRTGIFLFYLTCRYFAVLSVFSRMIYLCALNYHEYEALYYIDEISFIISFGCAYQLLAFHIISLGPGLNDHRRQLVLTYVVTSLQMGFWVLVVVGLSRLNDIWRAGAFQVALSMYLLIHTTLLVVLAAYALHTASRARSAPPSPCLWREVYDGGVLEIGVVWVARSAVSIYELADPNMSGYARMIAGFLAFVPTVACACRVYVRSLVRHDQCSLIERIMRLMNMSTHTKTACLCARICGKSTHAGVSPVVEHVHARDADTNVEVNVELELTLFKSYAAPSSAEALSTAAAESSHSPSSTSDLLHHRCFAGLC